jgi:hypothetical protein
MSTDEQFAAIGKMVSERADIRRQLALLSQELRDAGKILGDASQHFRTEHISSTGLITGIGKLESVNGGWDRLKIAATECSLLMDREAEITRSLRAAGGE